MFSYTSNLQPESFHCSGHNQRYEDDPFQKVSTAAWINSLRFWMQLPQYPVSVLHLKPSVFLLVHFCSNLQNNSLIFPAIIFKILSVIFCIFNEL